MFPTWIGVPYKGERDFRVEPGAVQNRGCGRFVNRPYKGNPAGKSLLLEEKVSSGVSRKPDDG